MAADDARNQRDWPSAAQHYRQVLDADPGRADIWVQYGHSLKEVGAVADAEVSYRRAIDIS